ncbi:lipoprotein-releasing ABC transporter permease subunit [Aureimonas jatrophae]|uniref:Lipoprotein-releasing system permease protein n=1 Tax=Aureimonas jatrophae TaxID=1166073 RepID=A0A1H0MBY0_9HYPH|nr:lipoprotein-releasing ABC transporter permease subunit [Aureimonas jatrophae]MBB3951140.1 lipoprotein-releasing system permease protein [Aureimonas jatrophae]SDO77726.1 lipoprotein-releasing system permease protein [Aureimonas jatrophae]
MTTVADLGAHSASARATGGTRPFSRFEWMIAGRYLRSRRRDAGVSVIAGFSFVGIMLGVAALIIVMSVMNGFRAELLTRILGVNGHVILQPMDRPLTDFEDVAAKIETVPGVAYTMPLVQGQVLASGANGTSTGALVKGVRGDDLAKLAPIASNVRQGTLANFDTSQGVAIGQRLADNLGLRLGDSITLVSPDGDVTPLGTTPRVKAYPIVAIYEIGLSEYDAAYVYMPLVEAQLFFNAENQAQSIEIFVQDPDRVMDLQGAIEQAAGRPAYTVTWQTQNQSFFSALEVERNVMFIILTLIVLVAALNIISGLFMLVKDKGRDIAIMRTMGATSGSIMRVFLITGASIGVAGTIAGFVLGTLFCLNIENLRQFFSWVSGTTLFNPEFYFLSRLPAEIDPSEVVTVVLMAVGLSFLATLFPSWRASKLDPVEALRYE